MAARRSSLPPSHIHKQRAQLTFALSAPQERPCFRSFYVSVEGEAVYLCCSGLTAFSSASNIRFYRWIYCKRNIWSSTNGHKAHLNVRITADPCTHQNFCDSLFIFSPSFIFQAHSVDRYKNGLAAAGEDALNSFQIECPRRQKQKQGCGSSGSVKQNHWKAKIYTIKKRRGGLCGYFTVRPYLYELSQTSPSVYTGRRLSAFMAKRVAALCLQAGGMNSSQ